MKALVSIKSILPQDSRGEQAIRLAPGNVLAQQIAYAMEGLKPPCPCNRIDRDIKTPSREPQHAIGGGIYDKVILHVPCVMNTVCDLLGAFYRFGTVQPSDFFISNILKRQFGSLWAMARFAGNPGVIHASFDPFTFSPAVEIPNPSDNRHNQRTDLVGDVEP